MEGYKLASKCQDSYINKDNQSNISYHRMPNTTRLADDACRGWSGWREEHLLAPLLWYGWWRRHGGDVQDSASHTRATEAA